MSSSSTLASCADAYCSSGDPFAADELVELLNDLVQNAESEDDLTAVLAQVEDVIVNDIVRSASSTSHSAAPDISAPSGSGSADVAVSEEGAAMETLIQATSITLLPVLVQFPASSPEAAESVLRLVLLIAQRANPKELLVGLEQALARLAMGSDSEHWEEEPGSQFGRILLASRVVIPRIKTRRLTSPLCSFLEVLRRAMTTIGEALDNDDTASAEADFLLSSILELLTTLAAFLKSNVDTKEADRLQVLTGLREALVYSGQTILPSASGTARLASSENSQPSVAPHASQMLATANALDLNLKAAFRHSPSTEQGQEAHTSVVTVLLAYEYRTKTFASPLDEDLALDVLRAFPYILAMATTTERRRLAAMTVDGSLYLLRSALECLEFSDEVTTLTRRAIEALCTHLDSLPPQLLPPSIALLAYAVREFPQDSPSFQDELLAYLLAAGRATHIRSIGIQILRSLLLDGSPEARDRIAAFTTRYGELVLEYTPSPTVELFIQDKTQTYLVSVLNLLYLLCQRDRSARMSDLWQASNQAQIRQSLIEPMQEDIRRCREAMTEEGDPDESMRIAILQDTLDRLVVALA